MSEQDRLHWDATYIDVEVSAVVPRPPAAFAAHVDAFPSAGAALDVACGTGAGSVWLARRGMHVWGVDVSPRAIRAARALAERWGVADRCRFDVVDLDAGLPAGPPVDVVLCHRFRDTTIYPALALRVRPGGLLAICVLSAVGAQPGRFRAAAGELDAAFQAMTTVATHEGDGQAWLLARAGAGS